MAQGQRSERSWGRGPTCPWAISLRKRWWPSGRKGGAVSGSAELLPIPPPEIPFNSRGLNQVAQSVVLLAQEVQQLRNEFDQRKKRKKPKEVE